MKGKGLHMITWILLIIGGLNWGLEGAIEWGLGDILSGWLLRVIYILVGVSALYELLSHKGHCKMCGTQNMGQTM